MLLLNASLDILAVTETKLANDITDDEIGIGGYFTIRKDPDRNGGGVLMYYKDSLSAYEEVRMQVPHTIESVWINVRSQSQSWLFACVYRPPLDLSFYDTFNVMLRYRGPIVWNSIPKFIRNVTSLQIFREKLKLASKTLDQIQFKKEACLIKSNNSAFLYF